MVGGDLYSSVNEKIYSEEMAIVAARQLLEGVEFIHRNNIVHRGTRILKNRKKMILFYFSDLKPTNVLLYSKTSNQLKISDFGLAIFAPNGGLDWYGHAGTVGYMSPEVLKREKYGKPVDIWALGGILYFMLSGEHAFWNDDIEELKKITISGKFTFSSKIWEKISDGGKKLIQLMLKLDQKSRILPEKALKNSWLKAKKYFFFLIFWYFLEWHLMFFMI